MDEHEIEITPDTLRRWMKEGKVVLVDVREPEEHAEESIEGAILCPTSQFNPAKVPYVEGKELVFHCAHGRRSGIAARKWRQWSGKKAYSLKGGIAAWKSTLYPTKSPSSPCP